MSDTNIAVVKKIYECFDAGDISGLLELVTDDFTFEHRGNDNPESPINKLWEGKSGTQSFFETFLDTPKTIYFGVSKKVSEKSEKVSANRRKTTLKEQTLGTSILLFFDF